jgi:energy-coupling factor transport system permease protein
MLVVLATRNPLYLIVILLIALVVDRATVAHRTRELPFRPLGLVVFAVVAGAIFNGLTAHFGDTVLLRLPSWIPIVGGAITLEGVTYGATNGLALGTIYSLFHVFNQVIAVHELIALAPPAFQEAGVVVSIALTVVPETTAAFYRVRDAQAIRGHRPRGLRDWVPLVVPLAIGSLERSTGLAEAMVARGYGSVTERSQPARLQAMLALGLMLVLGGWLALLFAPDAALPALVTVALGAGAIVAALRAAGRLVRRTRYRQRHWRGRDWVVLAGAALALAPVVLPGGLAAMFYDPYPAVTPPGFEPLIGLALLGLLAPALALRARS